MRPDRINSIPQNSKSSAGLFGAIRNFVQFCNSVWNALHESGKRWSTSRSFIWTDPPQDARFDVTAESFSEILRKSRYFEANNSIFNRLLDLIEQYCTPIAFIPASTNEDWNSRMRAWWLTNIEPELNQTQCARRWAVDGGILIHKSFRRVDNPEPGQPSLIPCPQRIEMHRIATPPDRYAEEGVTIVDGIELWPKYQPNGAPEPNAGRIRAFHVRESNEITGVLGPTPMLVPYSAPTTESWRRIDARDCVFITDPERPGQFKGLPLISVGLNDLHDLDDLQQLEMHAAKEEASVTWALENEAGEIPEHLKSARSRYAQVNQTAQGTTPPTEVTETRTQWMHKILGPGRKLALKLGEKLQRLAGERASVVTINFWEYLTSKFCAGIGISKLLVFPFSVQGTVTRADLDVSNTFFRSKSRDVLAPGFLDIYLWATKWAKNNVRELVDAPGDWNKVTLRAPRSVNVDVGRNSAAMINELNAGLRTFESCYAEFGLDWREQIEQRAREEQFINKMSKKYSDANGEVTPTRLREVITEQLKEETNPKGRELANA